jgi:hypothetical protein
VSARACSVTPVMNDEQRPSSAPGPAPRPGPRPGPVQGEQAATEQARALDASLDAALARLDSLDATAVHDHVDVFATVDRALRERLAGAEG